MLPLWAVLRTLSNMDPIDNKGLTGIRGIITNENYIVCLIVSRRDSNSAANDIHNIGQMYNFSEQEEQEEQGSHFRRFFLLTGKQQECIEYVPLCLLLSLSVQRVGWATRQNINALENLVGFFPLFTQKQTA